jgi:hypothetical protein
MNHAPEEDAAELAEALAALARAEETLRRLAIQLCDKFNRGGTRVQPAQLPLRLLTPISAT